MGLFKSRKNDEAFKIQLEREAIDKMNHPDDDFMLPLELQGEDSVWNISGKTKAPHTITADELNGVHKPHTESSVKGEAAEEIPMSRERENKENPSDFLYKKMLDSRNKSLESAVVNPKNNSNNYESSSTDTKDTKKPESVPSPAEPLDIDAVLKELKERANINSEDNSNSKPEKVLENTVDSAKTPEPEIIEFSSKKTEEPAKTAETKVSPAPKKPVISAEERRTTLLARCNAYLEDEEFGTAKLDTEKYKLESVESILEGFENRASQRVSKKFNTTTVKIPGSAVPPVKTSEPSGSETQVFSALNTDVDTSKVKNTDNSATKHIPVVGNGEIKHYFTAPEAAPAKPIENISSTRVMPEISSSSTSEDTPARKSDAFSAANGAVAGRHIDSQNEVPTLEHEETPEAAIDDYLTVADRDRVYDSLAHSRKKLSIRALLTFILFIPAVLVLTPLGKSLTASGMMTYYILDIVLSLLAIACNFNVIKSLGSLFGKNSDPDLPAALSIIGSTLFSIANFALDGEIMGFTAVSLLTLIFHNLAKRSFYTRAIKNFAIIANTDEKRAVSIVKNKNATKAMVGDAIEGGSLVCCGVKTTNLRNFLKYTYCNDPVAAKIKSIALVGLILGVGLGLAAMFLNSGDILSAFMGLAAALCISAAPSALLLTNLPFKSADGRLKLYDAMITGYRAADEFDLCNGVALSCSDLFPEGTIRLVDMKLLSPNPFDQSMLDAAAVAEAIGSPIAGIFRQVNAASSYKAEKPQVDSVIYEEKMGISGWVNDRRVFVGNRVLMEAHGFTSLPPIELDKKIMRKGYFPVYLASDNIPCALLVVKYSPDEDIAYELRRLCNTGTTVLVQNCDPNISDKMLCDYFGVYDETISVMSKQGSDQYGVLVDHKEERSAGAAYRSSASGLLAIMTASINIKKSISVMTVLYIASVVLGLLALGVCLFTSFTSFIAPLPILIFQLVTTLITCLPSIINKP